MKVKVKLESLFCADGVLRPVVMFPDGDYFPQERPIADFLMHLEVHEGMDLDNGFTVETEDAND